MDYKIHHPSSLAAKVWALAARQHGVVARWQLLALGMHAQAITYRLSTGRLHRVAAGVYAVGRPGITQKGWWMVAVLGCGADAVLSHFSAARLWGLGVERRGTMDVSVPAGGARRRPGITAHRRKSLRPTEITRHEGIPVTTPIVTLIDIASSLSPRQLERAINEADKLGLFTPEALRVALDAYRGRRGVPALRRALDRHTFTLTDSELERHFLPLAKRASLPAPQTGARVSGFKVDFYWPDLGLVVETDGLRYHRTPSQQARDHRRDQAHTAAGLTPLRFTHSQVYYEPDNVVGTLIRVAARLSRL